MTRRVFRVFIDKCQESGHRVSASSPVTALRIHPWVLWWFYVGVVCGVVAVANILFRDLTRTQERILLFLGVVHWLLGGLVCWACEGIQTERSMQPLSNEKQFQGVAHENEWHAPSDFLFPGGGRTLLPPSQARHSRELLDAYVLRHREQS
jgi:hypothetical protein